MGAAPGREPKIALVGATGTVGGQIVELIDARGFASAQFKLFAAAHGAAQNLELAGHRHPVAEFGGPADLADFAIAFIAVAPSVAADIVRARPGPILIDLSASRRAPAPEAPLVAPGITPRAAIPELANAHRVFAIPHPAAQVIALLIRAIEVPASHVGATLMESVSASGRGAVEEVAKETVDLLTGAHSLEEDETQRAFNAFPSEEDAALDSVIAAQTAALVGESAGPLLQSVNIPVLHGSALSLAIPGLADVAAISARMRSAPGILLLEDDAPAAGVIDAIGQEAASVRGAARPGGVVVWCVFDAARLAALSAVWVAESLMGVEPSRAT